MRSSPVILIILIMAAWFLVKLSWVTLTKSRGRDLIFSLSLFAATFLFFKLIGILPFWAVFFSFIAFPLALMGVSCFHTPALQSEIKSHAVPNSTLPPPRNNLPSCPLCGSKVLIRLARQGKNKGKKFLGCSTYPRCKGARSIVTE